jgi:hypothetical protein
VLLRRLVAVAFAGLLVLAVMAPVALAEERVCRRTIGTTAVDNLRVSQDASCTLNATKVQATVKVENGARLVAVSIEVAQDTAPSLTVGALVNLLHDVQQLSHAAVAGEGVHPAVQRTRLSSRRISLFLATLATPRLRRR